MSHRIRGKNVLCGSKVIGEVFANAKIRGEVMSATFSDGHTETWLRPHWGAIHTEDGGFAFIGYRDTKADAAQAVIDTHEHADG